MTTKEKIIRKSIKEVTKELAELKDLIYSSPLIEIIEIRKKAQTLLESSTKGRTSEEFLGKIKVLATKEKSLFKKAKKQENSVELIDRQVKLEFELTDLNHELYFITRNSKII